MSLGADPKLAKDTKVVLLDSSFNYSGDVFRGEKIEVTGCDSLLLKIAHTLGTETGYVHLFFTGTDVLSYHETYETSEEEWWVEDPISGVAERYEIEYAVPDDDAFFRIEIPVPPYKYIRPVMYVDSKGDGELVLGVGGVVKKSGFLA